MVSASPMASLPPGPASVLPEPGTTGITLALPGYSRKPPARSAGRQNFELLPAAVAGLTGGRGCHNLLRHGAQPRVTAITGTRCGDSARAQDMSSRAGQCLITWKCKCPPPNPPQESPCLPEPVKPVCDRQGNRLGKCAWLMYTPRRA